MSFNLFKLIIGMPSIAYLAWLSAAGRGGGYLLSAVALLFVAVCWIPFCKGRENLWVFFLTANTSIPLNIRLIGKADFLLIAYEGKVSRFLMRIVLYLLLLSVEELALGIVARCLWKDQEELEEELEEELYETET